MSKRLERMRSAPAAGWTISDVEAVCREAGSLCRAPSGGGSHYKTAHPTQPAILTVPARRLIKPIHIRKLVAFIQAVEDSR